MKKILALSASVLMCTLVFGHGTDGPIKGSSSVAVTNVTGSKLYKVYYKSDQVGKVKVSVLSENGSIIFSETLRKVNGFLRPYNFDGLPEGEYTIRVEDEYGKT